ncbi:MAG: hypothetical protein ACRCX2_01180 [Paraclostridium sp.]
MKESEIESQVVNYARELGIIQVKLNSAIGLPDRIFLFRDYYLLIEFKRENTKISKQQEILHRKWEKSGVCVYVIKNIQDGIRLIKCFYEEALKSS